MIKYKVQFSGESKNDFANIIKYIKYNLQETKAATKLSNKIKESIKLLSNNPKLYSIVDDEYIKKLGLRKLIVDNYLLFYKILEEEKIVQVVRIMYGRRNWIDILNKQKVE